MRTQRRSPQENANLFNGRNAHVHINNLLQMFDTKGCNANAFHESCLLGIIKRFPALFTKLRAADGRVDNE